MQLTKTEMEETQLIVILFTYFLFIEMYFFRLLLLKNGMLLRERRIKWLINCSYCLLMRSICLMMKEGLYWSVWLPELFSILKELKERSDYSVFPLLCLIILM